MNKIWSAFLLTVFTTFYAHAQISTCAYYDGYWGEWKKQYTEFLYSSNSSYIKIYGNYSGFIVYNTSSHPSEYTFKFQIDSYTIPTKELLKYHRKNNIWFEYTGYVEYFIDNSYPTIKEALRIFGFAYVSNNPSAIKRTAKARIKIAPYKDHPIVYNIFFEDVGIGIDLGTVYFKQ